MSDHYLTVRDHSQPCEHGKTDHHCLTPMGPQKECCPGGREIVLRKTRLSEWHPRFDDMQELWVGVPDE
jgi:hypothetical protein